MSISYFVTAHQSTDGTTPATTVDAAALAAIAATLAQLPGLIGADVCTPAGIETYHKDGGVPALTLRLDFDRLADLEVQLLPAGLLARLAESALWRSQNFVDVTHQAMYRREFLALDELSAPVSMSTYQVHYPGAAEDLNAWLAYYLNHHPQIMRDYPGVRRVEVFTRLDWYQHMPWRRVDYMQRNMLTFDDTEALSRALESPVRARMRADHGNFPPYAGGAIHYPMRMQRIRPA